MSNIYQTYCYIKSASIAGTVAGAGKGILGTTGAIASDTLNNLNPLKEGDDGTLGYSLGKGLTEFFLPKFYDSDNAGRYADTINYLKETEEGDQLLREAAKLRRRARILLRQLKEEEKNKQHAARSRYF